MSTSKDFKTPLNYMDKTPFNVLWELVPQAADDTAFHYGADICLLSQFNAEQEVLFPPCTLLVAKKIDGEQPDENCHRRTAYTAGKRSYRKYMQKVDASEDTYQMPDDKSERTFVSIK